MRPACYPHPGGPRPPPHTYPEGLRVADKVTLAGNDRPEPVSLLGEGALHTPHFSTGLPALAACIASDLDQIVTCDLHEEPT